MCVHIFYFILKRQTKKIKKVKSLPLGVSPFPPDLEEMLRFTSNESNTFKSSIKKRRKSDLVTRIAILILV